MRPFERRTKRFAAWLALVAMVALAVVPTVARALVPQSADQALVALCTTSGLRMVAIESPADEPQPAHLAAAFDHCALCGLAVAPVLPMQQRSALPPIATSQAAPSGCEFAIPKPGFVWLGAQPRAPPVSC